MKKYFLSYSRGDQAFALRFAHDLKAVGVDVWVDQFDIAIGQNWDRAVEAAVRGCEGFIIVLSPRSVASENVADEVGVALEGAKHIIPILYEKCTVPMRLARVQFIDSTSDYPAALQRCASIILGTPGNVRGPITSPAVAPMPASVPVGWNPQVLDAVAQKLVPFVGPVARVLVQKAALGATGEAELYQQLAVAIPNESERNRFLASVTAASAATQPGTAAASPAAASSGVLTPELINLLSPILTAYLGPIARHVLASEAREAKSRDDLYQRLGARIPSDKERAELLRKLRSH